MCAHQFVHRSAVSLFRSGFMDCVRSWLYSFSSRAQICSSELCAEFLLSHCTRTRVNMVQNMGVLAAVVYAFLCAKISLGLRAPGRVINIMHGCGVYISRPDMDLWAVFSFAYAIHTGPSHTRVHKRKPCAGRFRRTGDDGPLCACVKRLGVWRAGSRAQIPSHRRLSA